jgi:glycosyltransferase involved in cell wall biosynthesis
MKLLFFTENLGSGGSERQMVTIACAMKARGHEVSFLIYQNKIFYTHQLAKAGICVHVIESANKTFRFLKIRKFIWNHGQDLVLSYLAGPSFWAELSSLSLFQKRKWGLIASERGFGRLIVFLGIDIVRLAHYMADWIFSNSYANFEQILSNAPWLKDKVSVIYNLIDGNKFRKLDLPQSSFKNHIVIPARIAPVKNTLAVILAVARIKNKLIEKNAKIRWVGDMMETVDDSYVKTCQNQVEVDGVNEVFEFCQATIHIEDEYKKCGAVGLFSISEGLPNAVCEALCCGRPIVATRVSDVPRLVTDGWNGFTCEAFSIESIAEALSSFLDTSDEQRTIMSEHSYQRANELLAYPVVLGQLESLMETIVRVRGASSRP